MARKKDTIKTVINRGAIVAKKTKNAPEQGANSVSRNLKSAQGNTSNAYGKPSESNNPRLNHSTEFARPTQPAFQLEHGIANPIKDTPKPTKGVRAIEREAQKRTEAGQKQTESREKYGTTTFNSKLPSLYDYDPMPVEYGYKEDKAARERKRATDTANAVNKAASFGAIAPFLPELIKQQDEAFKRTQAGINQSRDRLRNDQKSGNTRLKYNGRGDEHYSNEKPLFGYESPNPENDFIYKALTGYDRLNPDLERTGGIDINNLKDYSDSDLLKARSDYAPEHGILDAFTNSHYASDYDVFNAIQNELNKRWGRTEKKKQNYQELVNDIKALPQFAKDALGVPASVAVGLAKPTDFVQRKLNKIQGHPYDSGFEDALSMSDYARAIQEGVTSNYDELTRRLFDLNTSLGTSVASMALAQGNPVPTGLLMGTSSAADTVQDALNRGVSALNADRLGNIQGLAEVGTETFELEALISSLEAGAAKSFKDVLMNMAKQAVNEGASEAVSEAIGSISDTAIAKERSQYNLRKQGYLAQGMSEEDAARFAMNDTIGDINEAFLGGALSGSILGGAGSTVNYIDNQKAQRAQNQAQINSLQNWAGANNAYRDMYNAMDEINAPISQEIAEEQIVVPESNPEKSLTQTELLSLEEPAPQVAPKTYEATDKSIKGLKNESTSIAQTVRQYKGDSEKASRLFTALNDYAQTGDSQALDYARTLADELDSELSGKVHKRGKATYNYADGKIPAAFDNAVNKINSNRRYSQYSNQSIDGMDETVSALRNEANNAFDPLTANANLDNFISSANEVMQTGSEEAWQRFITSANELANSDAKFRADENGSIKARIFDVINKVDSATTQAQASRAIAENVAEEPTLTSVLSEEETVSEEEPVYGQAPFELAEEARNKPMPEEESYTSRALTNTADRSFMAGLLNRFEEGINGLKDAKGNKFDEKLGRVNKVSEVESLTRARERLGDNLENVDSETERLLNLHDKEFSSTDMDEAMMILEYNLNKESASDIDVETSARMIRQIVEKSHNAGQTLQSLVKYSRTATGTLSKGQALIDDVVEEYNKEHQGQAKANARVAEKLSNIGKEKTKEQTQKKETKKATPLNKKLASVLKNWGYDGSKTSEKGKPSFEKVKQSVIATLETEYASMFNDMSDADIDFVTTMAMENSVSKEQMEDELQHYAEHGFFYSLDESLPIKEPTNQKLKNALKEDDGSMVKEPAAPKTHRQIVDEVKNTLATEYAVSSNKFDENDYEYIARMIEGGYSTKEIKQALDTKQATGSWGISDEDVQFVVDKFKEAEMYGIDSKDGYKALSEAYEKLAERLGDEGSFMDKWNQWRYLSMLGNLKTHGRNILSNGLFGVTTTVKDAIAAAGEAGYDKINRAFGGNGIERTKSILNLASKKDQALLSKANAYFNKFGFVPATEGGNKYNDASREIESRRKIFKDGNVIGKAAKANTNALTLEDNIAVQLKYVQALASYAKANGKTADVFNMSTQEDVDFLQKASDYAVKQAKTATFHEENALADAINNVEAIFRTSKNPLIKYGGTGLIEGLVPFKRTPANILKQGIKYTPGVGTIGTVYKAVQNLVDAKKGNEFRHSASEFINDLSEQLTGGMILALGAMLRKNGILRAGSDDKDKDYVFGDQEYSLNFGPYSYTIDWTAPAGMPLFAGAELYNALYAEGEKDPMEAIYRLTGPMMEMSMMQGIRDAMKSAAQTMTYGDKNQALIDVPMNLGLNYLSQGIPTLMGQVARSVDDTRRSTYVPEQGIEGSFKKWVEKQQNKIPFLSMQNQPYVNQFGEEEENFSFSGNPLERAFWNMISPGYMADTSRNEMMEELESLYDNPEVKESDFHDILPSLGSYKPWGDERLGQYEYTKYSKDLGRTYTDLVSELMDTPEYKNADDLTKASYIYNLKKLAKAMARDDNDPNYDIREGDAKKLYDAYTNGGGINGVVESLKEKADFDNAGVSHNKYTDAAYEKGEEEFNRATEVVNDLKSYGYDTGNKKALEAAENGQLDEYAQYDQAIKDHGYDVSDTIEFAQKLPSLDDFEEYANFVDSHKMKNNEWARSWYAEGGMEGLEMLQKADANKNSALTKQELANYLISQGYTLEQANDVMRKYYKNKLAKGDIKLWDEKTYKKK